MVTAGGAHLDGRAADRLAPDVGEVGRGGVGCDGRRDRRRWPGRVAPQAVDQLAQRWRAPDRMTADERGLGATLERHHD